MPGRRLTRADAWRDVAGAALAGAGLTALIHLTPPSLFEGIDWLQLHLPARRFMAAALAHGRLPLWNPYVALGRPFLADIETAVFYPPNLVFLVLDPSVAYALVVAAHAALAIWGMRQLGKHLRLDAWVSWLLGCAFVASEVLVSRVQAGHVHYGQAITYLPLLLLLAARVGDKVTGSRVLALAGALALQLLCGHPQIPWLSWLALGAFMMGRSEGGAAGLRRAAAGIAGLMVAVVGALALAAPTLLPFLEMVAQGNRGSRTFASAASEGMGLFYWSSLAVPDGGARAFFWESNLYSGLAVLVGGLAGLAATWDERETRGLVTMGVVGAALAGGGRTPLFTLFYYLVPGASLFRGPARAALLVVLSLILGLGLLLSRRPRGRAATAGLSLGALAGIALVGAYRAFVPAGVSPLAFAPRVAWLLLTLLALGLFLRAGTRTGYGVTAAALVAVLVADVGTAIPGGKAAWRFEVRRAGEQPIHEALRQWGFYADPSGVPPRVLIPPELARENAGSVFGWSSVAGYQAVWLARVWRFVHESLGIEPPAETTFPSPLIYSRGPFPYDSMNLVAGVDPGMGRLVARRHPDPRSYVATADRRVSDAGEAIRMIVAGHDFHRVPLVEGEWAGSLPVQPPVTTRSEITSFAAERIVVRTESPHPGLLVVAEPWYPGWEARVDGRPAPCGPANAWMRAVRVPAGVHEVVLSYRSLWLGPGLAVSSLALLGLGLWARRDARRRSGDSKA